MHTKLHIKFLAIIYLIVFNLYAHGQDIVNTANWVIGSSTYITATNLINDAGGIITNRGNITLSNSFANNTSATFNNLCGATVTVSNAAANSSTNAGIFTGATGMGSVSRFVNASNINNTGGTFCITTGISLSNSITGGAIGTLNKYVFINSSQASTCSGLTATFCSQSPAIPACSGTSYTTDNLNTSNGVTYISTVTQTRSALNMSNGATLIVCSGTLTLSSSNFNGGTIYVADGAMLNTDATTLNCTIINYGILNFTANLTVNSNGTLINGSTGIINASGNLFENSVLTNYGVVNITGTLTVQNAGSGACQDAGAKMNVSTVQFGNNTNAIVSPNGLSCVGVSSTEVIGSGSTKITNTSDLILCGTTTLTTNGNGDISTATVDQNCASCDAALPIELIHFQGKDMKEFIFLEWKTTSEKNNDFFNILRSYDGIQFENIAKIDGAGNSSTVHYYVYKDYDAKTGMNYYKLKQTDYDGKNTLSDIISVNKSIIECDILIYPVPAKSANINLYINKNIGIANVKCIDMLGHTIFTATIDTNGQTEFNLGQHNLPAGTFFIKLESENVVYIKEIVVHN